MGQKWSFADPRIVCKRCPWVSCISTSLPMKSMSSKLVASPPSFLTDDSGGFSKACPKSSSKLMFLASFIRLFLMFTWPNIISTAFQPQKFFQFNGPIWTRKISGSSSWHVPPSAWWFPCDASAPPAPMGHSADPCVRARRPWWHCWSGQSLRPLWRKGPQWPESQIFATCSIWSLFIEYLYMNMLILSVYLEMQHLLYTESLSRFQLSQLARKMTICSNVLGHHQPFPVLSYWVITPFLVVPHEVTGEHGSLIY